MRHNVWLTVDWDFFCPEPADKWAHAETQTYYGTVWEVRLALAKAQGYDLEAATQLGEPHPDVFWETLRRLGYRFDNLKTVVVGDSHQFGYDVFSRAKSEGPSLSDTRLINFDAHHDMTYSMTQFERDALKGHVTCENWLLMTHMAQIQLQSLIVFPPWKGLADWDRSFGGDRFPELQSALRRYTSPCVWPDPQVAQSAGNVELVYICRSSAWSPPWHDAAFSKFVHKLSAIAKAPVETPFKETLDPLAQRIIDYERVNYLAGLTDIEQISQQLENPPHVLRY
jgi:hypothetical protein